MLEPARLKCPPSLAGPVSAGSGELPSRDGIQAAGSRSICLRAHVADIGWLDWTCGGILEAAGTTGRNKAIEALRIYITGAPEYGDYCAAAHIRNIGWYAGDRYPNCAQQGTNQVLEVGTTGMNLPMESVAIGFTHADSVLHGWSHVQNIGWMYHTDPEDEDLLLGTEGLALNLEAVSVGFK